jgi:hypothetical protein
MSGKKRDSEGTHALGVFLIFVVITLWVTSSFFTQVVIRLPRFRAPLIAPILQSINKPFVVSFLNASLQSIFLVPYLFKLPSKAQFGRVCTLSTLSLC